MALLFFLFLLLPVTLSFLLFWLITKNKSYGKVIVYYWIGLFALWMLLYFIHFLTSPKVLNKKDYYGTYTIKKDYFKGKQTDWQYNHFRFEIKQNDSIYFYETERDSIINIYKGSISTVKPFNSERLVIEMEQPTSHILKSNPTNYRKAWSFYLVFQSPKFGNVFFEKGKWKAN